MVVHRLSFGRERFAAASWRFKTRFESGDNLPRRIFGGNDGEKFISGCRCCANVFCGKCSTDDELALARPSYRVEGYDLVVGGSSHCVRLVVSNCHLVCRVWAAARALPAASPWVTEAQA